MSTALRLFLKQPAGLPKVMVCILRLRVSRRQLVEGRRREQHFRPELCEVPKTAERLRPAPAAFRSHLVA